MRILLKCKDDNHAVVIENCERFELSSSKCFHKGALSWFFYHHDRDKKPYSFKSSDYKFVCCEDEFS